MSELKFKHPLFYGVFNTYSSGENFVMRKSIILFFIFFKFIQNFLHTNFKYFSYFIIFFIRIFRLHNNVFIYDIIIYLYIIAYERRGMLSISF